MPGTTPKGFRYPLASEAPDIAGGMYALATDIDGYQGALGAINFLGTATEGSAYQLSRYGNHVVFNDYVNVGANGMPNGTNLLNLQAGFRPKNPTAVDAPVYAAGSGWTGIRSVLEIGTDGMVTIRYTSASVPASSLVVVAAAFVGA